MKTRLAGHTLVVSQFIIHTLLRNKRLSSLRRLDYTSLTSLCAAVENAHGGIQEGAVLYDRAHTIREGKTACFSAYDRADKALERSSNQTHLPGAQLRVQTTSLTIQLPASADNVTLLAVAAEHRPYDTIRDVILTCAQKST